MIQSSVDIGKRSAKTIKGEIYKRSTKHIFIPPISHKKLNPQNDESAIGTPTSIFKTEMFLATLV